MSCGKYRRSDSSHRKGAMLVLVAITLVIFIIALVFSIDVAYMQLVRSQLRAAADAAAKAGAQALSIEQSEEAAISKAVEIAAENVVAGEPMRLANEDVTLGKSVVQADGSWEFVPGGEPHNAVRVSAERTTGSVAGPVRLLLGRILGTHSFEPSHIATASHVDQDIVLVLDRSGSMAWNLSGVDWAFPPGGAECQPPHATLSRWAAAREAVDTFLVAIEETLSRENVAIVSFSSATSSCGMTVESVTTDSGLSFDYNDAREAMARLSSNPIPGGTNIAAGIDEAVGILTGGDIRPFARKTIIVMTDGQWNEGRHPVEAASDAAAAGITVHAITFCDSAEQATMQEVARVGNGEHYHAPDAETLREIYREIAFTLQIILTE